MPSLPFQFPNKVPLANTPTPLVPLNRISKKYGGPKIWVKRDDLTGSVLSGNKIRKLEFVIAEALDRNADSLITCGGMQSNHCRATAMVGAQLGLDVHLLLREENDVNLDGNLLLDSLAGASINRISRRQYFSSLKRIFEDKKQELISFGRRPYLIPTGASDEVGIWGYIDCVAELVMDFKQEGIEPELIVCASGSGGTQAGLTLGASLFGLDTNVKAYAVCDNSDYFSKRVKEDIDGCLQRYRISHDISALKIATDDNYVGPGYALGYPALFETIKEVCRLEGVLLDPVYTGKAFHGLLTDISLGKYSNIDNVVFVHTGGMFGLFPFRNDFVD